MKHRHLSMIQANNYRDVLQYRYIKYAEQINNELAIRRIENVKLPTTCDAIETCFAQLDAALQHSSLQVNDLADENLKLLSEIKTTLSKYHRINKVIITQQWHSTEELTSLPRNEKFTEIMLQLQAEFACHEPILDNFILDSVYRAVLNAFPEGNYIAQLEQILASPLVNKLLAHQHDAVGKIIQVACDQYLEDLLNEKPCHENLTALMKILSGIALIHYQGVSYRPNLTKKLRDEFVEKIIHSFNINEKSPDNFANYLSFIEIIEQFKTLLNRNISHHYDHHYAELAQAYAELEQLTDRFKMYTQDLAQLRTEIHILESRDLNPYKDTKLNIEHKIFSIQQDKHEFIAKNRAYMQANLTRQQKLEQLRIDYDAANARTFNVFKLIINFFRRIMINSDMKKLEKMIAATSDKKSDLDKQLDQLNQKLHHRTQKKHHLENQIQALIDTRNVLLGERSKVIDDMRDVEKQRAKIIRRLHNTYHQTITNKTVNFQDTSMYAKKFRRLQKAEASESFYYDAISAPLLREYFFAAQVRYFSQVLYQPPAQLRVHSLVQQVRRAIIAMVKLQNPNNEFYFTPNELFRILKLPSVITAAKNQTFLQELKLELANNSLTAELATQVQEFIPSLRHLFFDFSENKNVFVPKHFRSRDFINLTILFTDEYQLEQLAQELNSEVNIEAANPGQAYCLNLINFMLAAKQSHYFNDDDFKAFHNPQLFEPSLTRKALSCPVSLVVAEKIYHRIYHTKSAGNKSSHLLSRVGTYKSLNTIADFCHALQLQRENTSETNQLVIEQIMVGLADISATIKPDGYLNGLLNLLLFNFAEACLNELKTANPTGRLQLNDLIKSFLQGLGIEGLTSVIHKIETSCRLAEVKASDLKQGAEDALESAQTPKYVM